MFAYCNNNPIIYADDQGTIAWLIITILVASTAIGAVGGYFSDEKIGQNQLEEQGKKLNPNKSEMDLKDPNGNITEPVQSIAPEDSELTTKDRVANVAKGAAIGLAAGGGAVILTGVGFFAATGSATSMFFGATATQYLASGALAYNVLPMILAPFVGIEAESLELDKGW